MHDSIRMQIGNSFQQILHHLNDPLPLKWRRRVKDATQSLVIDFHHDVNTIICFIDSLKLAKILAIRWGKYLEFFFESFLI